MPSPKLIWPEEVPVITGRDMLKGLMFNHDHTKACLLGWIRIAVGLPQDNSDSGSPTRLSLQKTASKFSKAVLKILQEEFGHNRSVCIINANDHKLTKAQAAKVFNKATASLGYTEGNPEYVSPVTKSKRIPSDRKRHNRNRAKGKG